MSAADRPPERGEAPRHPGGNRRDGTGGTEADGIRRRAFPVRILSVILDVGPEDLRAFLSLLQAGFLCEMEGGQNLAAFLRGKLGLGNHGDLDGILRVRLDDEPVHDIGKATLRGGSVLAVTGTVPEEREPVPSVKPLFGAPPAEHPVRPGNPRRPDPRGRGFVRLKLFGDLLENRGRPILRKGILIEGDTLDALFSGRERGFFLRVRRLRISGEDEDPARLGRGGLGLLCDWVHLVVRSP
jgi:hypothetical protein